MLNQRIVKVHYEGSKEGGCSPVLDRAIRDAITGLRGHGYSWADTGTRLGITRQSAWERWGGDAP